MSASNLPPGVSDSDIPGNRPEDAMFENFVERIERDLDQRNLDTDAANWIWTAGIRLWEMYEKMPHPKYTQLEIEVKFLREQMNSIQEFIKISEKIGLNPPKGII